MTSESLVLYGFSDFVLLGVVDHLVFFFCFSLQPCLDCERQTCETRAKAIQRLMEALKSELRVLKSEFEALEKKPRRP